MVLWLKRAFRERQMDDGWYSSTLDSTSRADNVSDSGHMLSRSICSLVCFCRGWVAREDCINTGFWDCTLWGVPVNPPGNDFLFLFHFFWGGDGPILASPLAC